MTTTSIEPIDIAEEFHKLCEAVFIPKGISKPHNLTIHAAATKTYARAVNEAGLHVTGKQVVEAIIGAVGWDMDSPWPGHPHPNAVIEKLKEEGHGL